MLGFHSLMTCLRLSLVTNTIAPQVNPAVVHQKEILCQWSLPCSCVLFGFYMLEKANDDQWTLAVSHTCCLCWQLGNTPWTPTWPYGSSTKIFPILPDVEITLDIQKSWSWASNRELFSALHVEGLPKPVTSAKNLGSFFRYIDENQTNVLAENRHQDAIQRLRQLSKLHLPFSDKLHLALTSVLPKWGYSCETDVVDWKELHKLQRTIADSVWKLSINGSPTVFFAWPNHSVTPHCGPFANHIVLERSLLF